METLTRLTITLPEAACEGGHSLCRQLLQALKRHDCYATLTRQDLGWVNHGTVHVAQPLRLQRDNLVTIEAVGHEPSLRAIVERFLPHLPEATCYWQRIFAN